MNSAEIATTEQKIDPSNRPHASRAERLTKVYGSGEARVTALDEVSVEFTAGTFSAIIGPSGSGKSTLMHCLAGLDTPTRGRVLIGDTEITGLADRKLTRMRRDRVGFVFQSFNLLPTLTARQNILLPLDLAGRRVSHDRFTALAESLGLSDRLSHRPSELSGGQQQRVAIARSLITRPDVVFADEPTGALDSRTAADLLSYLQRSCREDGQTVVMVTHDPFAASYADRTLLLADGAITDTLEAPDADAILQAMKWLDS